MPYFIKPKGINFSCCRDVHAANLSRILCRTVNFVQQLDPVAELERYDNWWEYQHLYFYCNSLAINRLLVIVKSPKNLLEEMHSDRSAFVGILPDRNLWCLRFHLSWDGEGFNLLGRFDVTLPQEIAKRYRSIIGVTRLELSERDAEACYDPT